MSELPEIKLQFQSDTNSVRKLGKINSRLAVLVLGMHRSGTSAIAGLVSKLGVGLPEDLIEAQPDNEKGFFESQAILRAHENLLAASGSSWNSLDDLSRIAETSAGKAFIAEMAAYLERQFSLSQSIVLKDPRMCRILEVWLPLIGELNAEVLAVHVVRNPLAVSASLLKRNDFSPGRSILIWVEHVLRAERQTRGLPRLFVNFDEVLQDWRVFAERLQSHGMLPDRLDFASRIEIETFLAGSMRHHKFETSDILEDMRLPRWVRETYSELEAAAKAGKEPDAALLDSVFADFDLARRLFNDVEKDSRKSIRSLKEVMAESVAASDLDVAAREAREVCLRAELQEALTREAVLAEAHRQFEGMVAELRAEIESANTQRLALSESKLALENEAAQLHREADEHHREIDNLKEVMAESVAASDLDVAAREAREVCLRAELQEALTREAVLAEAHRQFEGMVAELRAEIESANTQRLALSESKLALENEAAQLHREAGEYRREIDQSVAHAAEVVETCRQLEKTLSALRDEVEARELETTAARTGLAEVERSKLEIGEKLAIAQAEADNLQNRAALEKAQAAALLAAKDDAMERSLRTARALADAAVRAGLEEAARGKAEQARQYETAVQAVSESLSSAQREVDRLREEGLRQRRRADELSTYNQFLERCVRDLESAVRELRASTSWQITAPLRRAANSLKRARRSRKAATGVSSKLAEDIPEPSGLSLIAEQAKALDAPPLLAAVQSIVPRAKPVDIIIPVYRGLETTVACIESVLASNPGVEHEIVIIDDCSPEPEVSAYCVGLVGRPGIIVLRNEVNLGFVGTVNRGMALHPDRDVILLNSDTEVANDWLRKLVAAAYSAPRISSVTPFSNNATICSYPRFCEDNLLPDHFTLSEIDLLFAEANAGRSVDIPTAVGFCMFIRRDCLDEVGSFDEQAFGKGYGEENDFCLRASSHGWSHLLAADTFVFHKGGVSFKETAIAQQAKASEVIRERWPNYFTDVAKHVANDPERPFRVAATALRYKRDKRPKILILTHSYGGGVERHIEDLKTLQADYALFLTLRPAGGDMVSIETNASDGIRLEFDLNSEADQLASLIESFGFSRLHIHHILHYGEKLKAFVHRLNLPFDFTIHDYYSICPRIHLGGTSGAYCGEPEPAECNACIRKEMPVYDRSITEYRESRAWLVREAKRVIAPSQNTAERMRRYFPGVEINVVPHVSDRVGFSEPSLPNIHPDERLRVLVLGILAPHKGLAKVTDLIEAADASNAALEVHLLGKVEGASPQSTRFISHGQYEDSLINELIDQVNPHIIWFPAQVPETFSYTLEAALAAGRPIASSDLGSLPERLSSRAWTWVWPWSASSFFHLEKMLEVRDRMLAAMPPPPPETSLAPLVHDGFYQLRYLGDVRARPATRRRVVAVDCPVMPTACGQIRVALPLTYPSIAEEIQLDILPFEEAMKSQADAILVQRNAVIDRDAANKLADHCDRRGIRKLFEIDDDLFALPETHLEKAVYEQQLLGAKAFMERADSVIVTTEVLAARMRIYNPSVHVIANNLDDRLWFSGGRGYPRPRRPGEKLRVAFIGGSAHGDDLDSIASAMSDVMRRRPGAVEFHMVGASFSSDVGLPVLRHNPPAHLAGRYVCFVDWLRRSANWHVGIAPLISSEFNAAKSPLKFLDYGALGLAGVYSNESPFRGVVEHGETGLLAMDANNWADAVIQLLDDDLRLRLATSARSEVRSRHTLKANAKSLSRKWLALVC